MVNYIKEELENYILVQKLSYEEIGKIYSVSGSAIKKAARKNGISLVSRRKINIKETFNKGVKRKAERYCITCGKILKHNNIKCCSKKCTHKYERVEHIKKWLQGSVSGATADGLISKHIRKYLLEINNNSCEKCGWNQLHPNSKVSLLHIHHIDGDATNNLKENLQVLCPNCHSLTKNYGSYNKISTRKRSKTNKK